MESPHNFGVAVLWEEKQHWTPIDLVPIPHTDCYFTAGILQTSNPSISVGLSGSEVTAPRKLLLKR